MRGKKMELFLKHSVSLFNYNVRAKPIKFYDRGGSEELFLEYSRALLRVLMWH